MNINDLLTTAAQNNGSPWYLIILAFFAGLLVSFTPCVYTMVPITAGILQAQAGKSLWYNILSALTYICGIALVYATLGYLSATSTLIFGSWLSNPWVIVFVIAFFIYLSGTMFGWYELYLPSLLTKRDNMQAKGSLAHSFVYGLISGTVATPCLTPPLAVLLGIVAKQGSPLLGFVTLFSFSLGMGMLLLLIGTFSSTLTLLPHTGIWMELIKTVFGFLIIAACVHLAEPFLANGVTMLGYFLICFVATIYYLMRLRTSRLALVLGILSLLATIWLGGTILQTMF
jgi:thiol:disulfide interchange protein DsbD